MKPSKNNPMLLKLKDASKTPTPEFKHGNLISKKCELDYFDHLDDRPLKHGDRVRATFPSGQVIDTTISLQSECVSSSPGFGDIYEHKAFIVVSYYGIKGELSLRDHPEVLIERI